MNVAIGMQSGGQYLAPTGISAKVTGSWRWTDCEIENPLGCLLEWKDSCICPTHFVAEAAQNTGNGLKW
jgi:hypothetical protein